MKVISVWTPKGGVGKTTTTLHLADCISQELGLKVIVYDVDDQFSLYDTVKDKETNFNFEVTEQFPEGKPDCDVFIMDFRPSGIKGKGALTRQELNLLKNSDVIVSPIRASRLDIKSQNAIKDLDTKAKIVKVLCCLDLRVSDQKQVYKKFKDEYSVISYKSIYARTINDFSTIYTRKNSKLYGTNEAKKEIRKVVNRIMEN